MDKSESLKEFYQRKYDWMPGNLCNEIGHFNVFRLEPFVGDKAKPVPYKRRDFYKIMLVVGGSRVHYADKVVEVRKQALSFSNPTFPTSGSTRNKPAAGSSVFSTSSSSISTAT